MISTATGIEDLTLDITEEIHVRAPLDVTFAALLEQLGPLNEVGENRPLPMKPEPWPGGRWYRDLGDNNGHFWGHVQAIKRPTLLEISGPLIMSYPITNNLQYRLSESDGGTRPLTRRSRQSSGGTTTKSLRYQNRDASLRRHPRPPPSGKLCPSPGKWPRRHRNSGACR